MKDITVRPRAGELIAEGVVAIEMGVLESSESPVELMASRSATKRRRE